jgi:serine/threonine protein kinase
MTASTRSAGNPFAKHAPPPPHVELEPGTTLGRYRIGEEMGRGSYAVVYQGRDTCLQRDVALKTMPGCLHPITLDEARLLCRIQHRHVVTIHDCVRDGDVEALVLELVSGASLSALARQGPLPAGDVVEIGAQLAAGLGALHSAGVLHRDIKPANLRLTADGALKILDLGVGCRLTAGAPMACATAPVAGTIPYMSPERLQGSCGDARSDLWSAGAVLFELATGRRVVDGLSETGQDRFVRDGQFPDPWRLASSLPYPLAEVVARSLAPDPAGRYQSAQELLDDLLRISPRIAARTELATMAAFA